MPVFAGAGPTKRAPDDLVKLIEQMQVHAITDADTVFSTSTSRCWSGDGNNIT
jgi:hypothetical protein